MLGIGVLISICDLKVLLVLCSHLTRTVLEIKSMLILDNLLLIIVAVHRRSLASLQSYKMNQARPELFERNGS